MFNLLVWVMHIIVVLLVWKWIIKKEINVLVVLLTLFLFAPFNYEDDIFTVFGSARAENGSVYSLSSLYHYAKENSLSIFPAVYQKAQENTTVLFGGVIYQESEKVATVGLGVSVYQNAPAIKNDFTLSIYEKAKDEARNWGLTIFRDVNGHKQSVVVGTRTEG